MQSTSAWEGVPRPTLAAIGREAEGREILGVDCPMPNGLWKCIGCGRIVGKGGRWANWCSDCGYDEWEG